jgi:hypothetical protein
VTVAKTPLPITLSFVPKTTQVVLPLALEHITLAPAAVATAPAVTVTPEMSDAG